jgi:LuxR family maltose regulon positive regulatory protein
VDSLVGLAVTKQLLGCDDDAWAAMQDLLDFVWESNNPSYLTIARSCQARLALLQGDILTARGWIDAADWESSERVLFFWLEIPHLTQSKLLIAESTEAGLATAAEELASLRQLAEDTNNTGQLIEILVLQARLYQKQGRIKEALAALRKALSLAAPGGWLRPFIEAGSDLSELYLRLSPAAGSTVFLEKIKSELAPLSDQKKSQGKQAVVTVALEEDLTFREREVLALLAKHMSNIEIAAQLVISPNTVKRHTTSLYRKLNVRNRRQAVVKARQLRLLPLD